MNIAFGAEYRTENFIIFSGQEASYTTYDANRLPVTNQTPVSDILIFRDSAGNPILDGDGNQQLIPGSSQGFPGYSPLNAVDKNRSNLSLYADTEFDITKSFMISGAARYEKYSDFGSTINGKLASRLKLSDKINLRGSLSTGFRAPSLAQAYYGLYFTNINAEGATDILLSPNDSPVTRSFGIQKLKQETAVNASLGLTANFSDFTATIDGYMINVKDRIVLTSYFDASSKGLGADQAQFFANAADTKTVGLDLVLAWKKRFNESKLSVTFVGNINDMKIAKVNNGSLDAETFFGKREQAFLLASAPKNKFGLNLNYSHKKFDSGLAFTRFSKVVLIDYAGLDNVYTARLNTDLTLGYQFTKQLKFTLGSNNLFNVYPTQQDESGNTEAGGYWDAVQMGFNGAYYYARLGFSF
jgi:iron complex outermembrane receptor protein